MSADGNEGERKAVSAAGKGKRKAVYRNDRRSPGGRTHLRDAATPNGTEVRTLWY